MSTPPTAAVATLLWRGATRACPVCGRRGLTRRGRGLVTTCPRCGFRFERSPGHFTGAVGMNTIITFGLILVTLLGGIWLMWPDLATVPLMLATVGVAVVVPVAIHPTTKTLWAAIDLAVRPLEPGEACLRADHGIDTDFDAQEGTPQQR